MWSDIPGCPGFQASDEGEILNALRGRIVRQRRNSGGAMQVEINGATRMAHELVAMAFHGCPPCKGYRVRHRSSDRGDNRPENLVWSGAPKGGFTEQKPTQPLKLEQEYERVRLERLSLVELMS